jgi:hypothetical protein
MALQAAPSPERAEQSSDHRDVAIRPEEPIGRAVRRGIEPGCFALSGLAVGWFGYTHRALHWAEMSSPFGAPSEMRNIKSPRQRWRPVPCRAEASPPLFVGQPHENRDKRVRYLLMLLRAFNEPSTSDCPADGAILALRAVRGS